jgi:hypothetical protein
MALPMENNLSAFLLLHVKRKALKAASGESRWNNKTLENIVETVET